MKIFNSGDQLDQGRYVIENPLGVGGMGQVYIARQPALDRKVAIKVLHPTLSIDPTFSARFKREAKLMAALNHRNCVTVFDYGETEQGLLYIVMEYLEGHTLADELYHSQRLSPKKTFQIMTQVCSGIFAAHQIGLVHRDLKPENIFLIPDHEKGVFAKVLDFGLAKIVQDEADLLAPSDDFSNETEFQSLENQENYKEKRSNSAEDLTLTHSSLDETELSADSTQEIQTLDSISSDLDSTLIPSNKKTQTEELSSSPLSEDELDETLTASQVLKLKTEITPPSTSQSRSSRQNLTKTGQIFGTPMYMSPEQANGLPVDHRADIYALGLIFYECLTGQLPFKGHSAVELMIAHAVHPPSPLSQKVKAPSKRVENLIDQCLAKSVQHRPSQVKDMIDQLHICQEDLTSDLPFDLLESTDSSTSLTLDAPPSSSPLRSHSATLPSSSLSSPSLSPSPTLEVLPSELNHSINTDPPSLHATSQNKSPSLFPIKESKIETLFLSTFLLFTVYVGIDLGVPLVQCILHSPPLCTDQPTPQYDHKGKACFNPTTTSVLWNFDTHFLGQTASDLNQAPIVPSEASLKSFKDYQNKVLPQKITPNGDEPLDGFSWSDPEGRGQFDFPFNLSLEEDFTLEMWFKPHSEGNTRCGIFLFGNYIGQPNRCELNAQNAGWGVIMSPIRRPSHMDQLPYSPQVNYKLSLSYPYKDESKIKIKSKTMTFLIHPFAIGDQWNHIVLIKDKRSITSIMNGKKTILTYEAKLMNVRNAAYFHFGRFLHTVIESYRGEMDEIRVSSVPLNPDQIIQAYQNRLASHKRAEKYFSKSSSQ